MSRVVVFVGALAALACGGGSKSPTAPGPPPIVQVAGVWTATMRLTGVGGGECVGDVLAGFIGDTERYTAAITQAGASLTATVSSQETGLSCSHTGTAGSTTISLNATSCQAAVILGLRCRNGALRDLTLVGQSLTGTVAGNTMTGTWAETWNVYRAGTFSGVGVLTLNGTFTATR